MYKIAVVGEGINFTLDDIPQQAAVSVIRMAIAGKYGPAQKQPVSTPATVILPEQVPEIDNQPDNDQDGDPP